MYNLANITNFFKEVNFYELAKKKISKIWRSEKATDRQIRLTKVHTPHTDDSYDISGRIWEQGRPKARLDTLAFSVTFFNRIYSHFLWIEKKKFLNNNTHSQTKIEHIGTPTPTFALT